MGCKSLINWGSLEMIQRLTVALSEAQEQPEKTGGVVMEISVIVEGAK